MTNFAKQSEQDVLSISIYVNIQAYTEINRHYAVKQQKIISSWILKRPVRKCSARQAFDSTYILPCFSAFIAQYHSDIFSYFIIILYENLPHRYPRIKLQAIYQFYEGQVICREIYCLGKTMPLKTNERPASSAAPALEIVCLFSKVARYERCVF